MSTLDYDANMPVHPVEACYCHIIQSGLSDLERLTGSGATDCIRASLQHLRAVSASLDSLLLHPQGDPRHDVAMHDRYWNDIRPQFLSSADRDSRRAHADAWEFLALATRGNAFYDSIRQENDTGMA